MKSFSINFPIPFVRSFFLMSFSFLHFISVAQDFQVVDEKRQEEEFSHPPEQEASVNLHLEQFPQLWKERWELFLQESLDNQLEELQALTMFLESQDPFSASIQLLEDGSWGIQAEEESKTLRVFSALEEPLSFSFFLYVGLAWLHIGNSQEAQKVWQMASYQMLLLAGSQDLIDNDAQVSVFWQEEELYQVLLWYNQGNLYSWQGLFHEAIASYTQALTLNDNFAPAYLNRGNAYLDILQKGLALQDYLTYQEFLQVDSTLPDRLELIRMLRRDLLREQHTQNTSFSKADFIDNLSKEELLDLLKDVLNRSP